MLRVSVADYADHRPDCPAHVGYDCTCGFEQAKSACVAAIPDWTEGDPPRVFKTKTRSWYEDRAGRRYQADEPVAWGSPAVDTVLQAAAKAASPATDAPGARSGPRGWHRLRSFGRRERRVAVPGRRLTRSDVAHHAGHVPRQAATS